VFTAPYGPNLSDLIQVSLGYWRPCHGSGGETQACHLGGQGSIAGHCMWDLWSTEMSLGQGLFRVLLPSFVSIILPMIWTNLYALFLPEG